MTVDTEPESNRICILQEHIALPLLGSQVPIEPVTQCRPAVTRLTD